MKKITRARPAARFNKGVPVAAAQRDALDRLAECIRDIACEIGGAGQALHCRAPFSFVTLPGIAA